MEERMKVAIFMYGELGKMLYDIIDMNLEGVEVSHFVDNNPNKLGEIYGKASVISPYKIKTMLEKKEVDTLLIPTAMILSYALDEIISQIKELGIEKFCVVPAYIFRKAVLDEADFASIFTDYRDLNQLQHLQFHVADNCNLKCKRCQHFSNIVKEDTFSDYDMVIKDLNRLSDLLDNINVITILGGEPLLNPELSRYLWEIRKIYPYSKIQIITNALLIQKMDKELIASIRENDVLINVSYYPPLVKKIDAIHDFLDKNDIKYIFGMKIDMFSKKMDTRGLSVANEQFSKCRDRCCTMLKNGKLYPCYLPGNINYFNLEFGMEIDGDSSGIDIYNKDINGMAILERLKRGFDICRYCGNEQMFKWESSDKDVDALDWVID